MPEINLPTKAGQDSIISTIGGVNTNVDNVKAKTDTINTNVNTINTNVNTLNTRTNTMNSDLSTTKSQVSTILTKINNKTAASYFEGSTLVNNRYQRITSEYPYRVLSVTGKGKLVKITNVYAIAVDVSIRLNNGIIYSLNLPAGTTEELNWFFESILSISVSASGVVDAIKYEYLLM